MVKHHPNGLHHRSVGDYAKMKFDKVKQAVGDKVQGAKKFVSGKVRDVRKSMQPKNVSLMGVRTRNLGAGLTANADKGMASALTHANKYGGDPVQHITSRIARRKLQANLRAKMMAGALLRNKFAIGGVAAAGGAAYALHKRRQNRNPDIAASQTLSLARSLFGGRQPNDPITHMLKVRGGDIVGNIPAGVRRHGRLAKRVGLNKQMVQNTFGAGNKLRKPVQHALRVIAKNKPQLAALAGLSVGAGVVASRMMHGKKKATSLSLSREVKFVEYANNCLVLDASSRKVD